MAEKLTPTFVFKLIVLFALLITGVLVRTKRVAFPADAASVQNFKQPASTDQSQPEEHVPYHKVIKREKSHSSSPAI